MEQKKASSNDRVSREQPRSPSDGENADRENYRGYSQGDRWKRKDFRRDNAYRSHQRQTDEWLARRIEQLHLLGFSLIGALQGKPQSRAATIESLKMRETPNVEHRTVNCLNWTLGACSRFIGVGR